MLIPDHYKISFLSQGKKNRDLSFWLINVHRCGSYAFPVGTSERGYNQRGGNLIMNLNMPWLGQLFQKQESRSSFRVSSFCAGAAIRWRSEGSGDCRPLCHRGGVRRAALLRELRQVLPQLQLQFVLLINMEGPEAFSRPEAKLRNGDASDFSEIIQEIGTICLKKTLASVLVLKLLHYCNSKKHLEWWFLSCFFPFLPVTITAFFFLTALYIRAYDISFAKGLLFKSVPFS